MLWTIVEPDVYLITATLPSTRMSVKKAYRRIRRSLGYVDSSSGYLGNSIGPAKDSSVPMHDMQNSSSRTTAAGGFERLDEEQYRYELDDHQRGLGGVDRDENVNVNVIYTSRSFKIERESR